jgi:hypothetical protein
LTGSNYGIGPHATEDYREKIEFEMFGKTDFAASPEELVEAARLIVEDMTEHFNLGLVIPLDAPRDFNG